MKDMILGLFAGIFCGVVFRFLRLPLPSPPVFAGVMGITGVFLGGKLFDLLLHAIKLIR